MSAVIAWLAARALPVRAFLGSIPPKVWLALGIAVALFTGFLVHQHYAHKAIAAAEQRGEARAYANVAKQAQQLASKANALNAGIAAAFKEKNREEDARIAAAADTIRLRGPGAARCAAVARLPASAGGPEHAAAKADAAVDRLPDEERVDLIGLPFAGAVAGAEEHDRLLNEDASWRAWYARFTAEWAKWQAEAAKAR